MLQSGSKHNLRTAPLLNALPSADSESDNADEDALSADEWKVSCTHSAFAAEHSTLQDSLTKQDVASATHMQ